MSPADAVKLINGGATVLDIRPAERFAAGHIIGAVNIPAGELAGREEEVAKKKDRPVIVCCENGTTSARAATMLRKAAYPAVVRLKGGVMAWERESLPLSREEQGKKRKGRKS